MENGIILLYDGTVYIEDGENSENKGIQRSTFIHK